MENDVYILASAINISMADSAICVPLFLKYPENATYLPVTDEFLQIRCFQEIYEFENQRLPIPGDLSIDYSYSIGDLCPLILRNNRTTIAISSDSLLNLTNKLRDLVESPDDIFSELLRDVDQAHLRRQQAYENDSGAATPLKGEIEPKGAIFWLDEAVKDLRIHPDSVPAATLVRLKLLSWARDIAENATSRLFAHFLSSLHTAEQAGVYVEDLHAVALLRRISEDVPRATGILNLVMKYRAKYRGAPLRSVVELRDSHDGIFSEYASDVLDTFFAFTVSEVRNENVRAMMLLALTTDDEGLWPPEVSEPISAKMRRLLSQLAANADSYSTERLKLAESVQLLRSEPTSYRQSSHPVLRAAHRHRENISKFAMAARSDLTLLDSVAKVKHGIRSDAGYSTMALVDYKSLGLNEDFFTQMLSMDDGVPDDLEEVLSGH